MNDRDLTEFIDRLKAQSERTQHRKEVNDVKIHNKPLWLRGSGCP